MRSGISLLILMISLQHYGFCQEESITEVSDECENHTPQPAITPLEARREVSDDMVTFTVKYQSSVKSINASWQYASGEDVQGTTTTIGRGVYETSTTLPVSEVSSIVSSSFLFAGSAVHVFLSTPDSRESLLLALRYEERDELVTEIPVILLEVQPAGDLVYEEGEDVTMKVIIPGLGEHGTDRVNNYTGNGGFIMYDPDTGDVIDDIATDIGDLLDEKDCPHSLTAIFRFNSSINGLSGLIEMNTGVFSDEGLITLVMRYKKIVMRPSTQVGPFPDGFLGFVKEAGRHRIGFGTGQLNCWVGEECVFHCRAVGSDITDLSVVKITDSGRTEPVDSSDTRYSVEEFADPYSKTKQVKFTVDSVPEEPDNFRCVARNADGKEVFMEAALEVVIPMEIIEEDSGIELVTDQETEDSKTFKISCKVKGHPEPNVTFTTRTDWSYDGYQPADEILELGDHSYTMIKYETFNAREYTRPGWYLSSTCEARLDEPYWRWMQYELSYDGDLK